jgi:hypothetical protein
MIYDALYKKMFLSFIAAKIRALRHKNPCGFILVILFSVVTVILVIGEINNWFGSGEHDAAAYLLYILFFPFAVLKSLLGTESAVVTILLFLVNIAAYSIVLFIVGGWFCGVNTRKEH